MFALYADRIVLGGLVTPSLLGQFAIAATLVGAIQGIFARLNLSVVMPVLSETVRGDRGRLKEVFYRVRLPTDLTLLFCAGLLAATGQLVVDVLYDRRYAEAGWMLQILAVSLVWARQDATRQLYLALGQPKYVAFLNFARFVSVFAALFVGFHLGGIRGAIWGFVLYPIVIALMSYRFNAELRINDLGRDLGVLVACRSASAPAGGWNGSCAGDRRGRGGPRRCAPRRGRAAFFAARPERCCTQTVADHIFHVPGRWTLKRCTDSRCGLVWQDPMLIAEDIGRAYDSYYTSAQADDARADRAVRRDVLPARPLGLHRAPAP